MGLNENADMFQNVCSTGALDGDRNHSNIRLGVMMVMMTMKRGLLSHACPNHIPIHTSVLLLYSPSNSHVKTVVRYMVNVMILLKE